jgi:hypothetical protein
MRTPGFTAIASQYVSVSRYSSQAVRATQAPVQAALLTPAMTCAGFCYDRCTGYCTVEGTHQHHACMSDCMYESNCTLPPLDPFPEYLSA